MIIVNPTRHYNWNDDYLIKCDSMHIMTSYDNKIFEVTSPIKEELVGYKNREINII